MLRKLLVAIFGMLFMFFFSILLQNFAILMIFAIACIPIGITNYFGVDRLKAMISGVTVFFVLSFSIPNKIPVFFSGCVLTAMITYYGVKWYSLKPLREVEKKKEQEYKRVLNNVWKATEFVLNKKPEGLKPNDLLPEVMRATGLSKKEIFHYWRFLEFHSKINKKKSKYHLVPAYVRIFKEPIKWLVIFYMFVGWCAYLLFIAWLIYIVVFEWVLHLPLIPWWLMIQQLFNGGPATIGLYIFLGIGLFTYLMEYVIEHGWQPVKNFTRHFAKRAALIIPQLSITLYVLLVYFKVVMPLEPFLPAFFSFVERLGIFSAILTLPTFLYCISVIVFSVLGMALANDNDMTLKAPLLFLPIIIYTVIAKEQHEVQSYHSYITARVNPIAQMDFIRQRMHEKAIEKEMLERIWKRL